MTQESKNSFSVVVAIKTSQLPGWGPIAKKYIILLYITSRSINQLLQGKYVIYMNQSLVTLQVRQNFECSINYQHCDLIHSQERKSSFAFVSRRGAIGIKGKKMSFLRSPSQIQRITISLAATINLLPLLLLLLVMSLLVAEKDTKFDVTCFAPKAGKPARRTTYEGYMLMYYWKNGSFFREHNRGFFCERCFASSGFFNSSNGTTGMKI